MGVAGRREGEKQIYFKELAHAVVGAGKSEICKAGQQVGTQGRLDVAALSAKAVCKPTSLLSGYLSLFS